MIYFYAVVNESVVAYVGELVRVRENVRVTINCSELINRAINDGVPNPTVTWFKDGLALSNGSQLYVVISDDNRLCIIAYTFFLVGGQLGNGGSYTCEVCRNVTTNCMYSTTPVVLCGE